MPGVARPADGRAEPSDPGLASPFPLPLRRGAMFSLYSVIGTHTHARQEGQTAGPRSSGQRGHTERDLGELVARDCQECLEVHLP